MCSRENCYNSAMSSGVCGDCSDDYENYSKPKKPFAEGMNEAFQTLEERMEALEADVKRLKRELGLK